MTETSKTLTVTYDRADERSKVVPLKWPFTVNGTRYENVTVRRITVAEIDAWVRGLAAGGTVRRPAMFDLSDEIMGLVDAEDGEAIDVAANDFLPRRYRMTSASTSSSE